MRLSALFHTHCRRAIGMLPAACTLAAFGCLPAAYGDWNPRLAAQYLDSRQKEWFAWKIAASPNGPCVSCHTGLPYLFARPALRQKLGEREPTEWEAGLMNRLKSNAGAKKPGILQGVEVTMAALFLARESAGANEMNGIALAAFDQMWSMQTHDGDAKGGIPWYSAKLDPWETPEAFRWGSAFAALAADSAPASYRERQDVRADTAELAGYLRKDFAAQPLHHRLALLLPAGTPGLLTASMKKELIDGTLALQQADGGWTIQSLGPWAPHPEAPASEGSNAYATAYAAWTLEAGGVPASNAALRRALDWLESHQDRATGSWIAQSMNKRYPAGSMESKFVADAATAFAALALVQAGR